MTDDAPLPMLQVGRGGQVLERVSGFDLDIPYASIEDALWVPVGHCVNVRARINFGASPFTPDAIVTKTYATFRRVR